MAKLISQQTNRHQRAKIELNENRINRWLAEGPWGGGTRYQYLRRASNRRIKRQLRVASKSRMRPRHSNQGCDLDIQIKDSTPVIQIKDYTPGIHPKDGVGPGHHQSSACHWDLYR